MMLVAAEETSTFVMLLSRSQTLQDILRERREEIKRGETITLKEAFSE
jgi:hypothetical protein